MNLYELSEQHKTLLWMLEDDPENEAIKEMIALNQLDIQDKAEGIVHIIRQLEADAAAAKAEKQRLATKQSTAENGAKRLREALKEAMSVTGITKIKKPTCSVTLSTRWETVLDVEPEDLPEEFKKVTVEPKKAEITKWLKAYDPDKGGTNLETCEWAHLEQTETLTVR